MTVIPNFGDKLLTDGYVVLRPGEWRDRDDLLAWRNDPLTRSFSRNQDSVAPETHEIWLKGVLASESRLLFIAEVDGEPVGTVRADFSTECELSWTVAPSARGQGIGARMVSILARVIDGPLVAEVRVGNPASIRIAESLGMQPVAEADDWIRFRRRSSGETKSQ